MKSTTDLGNQSAFASERSSGLTKKEYFAAAALNGIMSSDIHSELSNEHAARIAVNAANELINALIKDSK
jgi:hypothetical protein